mgnify:CR=1 FL=1
MSKTFIDGMIFREPLESAPKFVKGKISVKVDDFIKFAKQYQTKTGWLNIDLNESHAGKLYLSLNEYKPKEKTDQQEVAPIEESEDIKAEDLPF